MDFKNFKPCRAQLNMYLKKWNELPRYVCAEKALDRLFGCQGDDFLDESDLMIKCSTLNDFYSTNIYDVYPVVLHYLTIDTLKDDLLNGELSLVNKLTPVPVKGKKGDKTFYHYSFATKFCSHHNPEKFPIFDYYVEKMLKELRNRDKLISFRNDNLHDYEKYVEVIDQFKTAYDLDNVSYKHIDIMLWLAGKDYFPKKY